MKHRLQNRSTRVDIAALLAFAALWIYYIVVVRYGACFADEHFYVTFAQRFVYGDRPLVDDWHLAQFSCLFLCIPYRIWVALKGSSAGIILFMRYLFVVFNAIFYWFMYVRLRAYRWLDLVATILFCAYIPGGLFACNYYTLACRLPMMVCLILFAEKQKPLSLMIAGVLLSCAVLVQPGFAFLYLGYSVLVWVRFFRQKKGKPFLDDYAFCVNTRTWIFLSLSVLICAAAFLTWLFIKSGLRNILDSVPYLLFTDPEYDFSAHGQAWGVFFRKLSEACQMFGSWCWIPAIVTVALSAAYARGLVRARREPIRKLLFCLACAAWILSCIPSFRMLTSSLPGLFFKVYPAPLMWFGLVCYLLCEQKNKRLFFFWIVGLCASLCIDFFSEIALSVAAPITYIAVLAFFTELVREMRAESLAKKPPDTAALRRRKRDVRLRFVCRWVTRLTCGCFAVWFAFLLLWENTVVPGHNLEQTPLFSFPYLCETGPCRSLRYPQKNGENYSAMLSDIDTLKKTQPKNLFVYGMAPELYLYADLPYATYNPWTWRKETFLNRHVQYWLLHPERRPACIYIPFFEAYEPVDPDAFSAEDFLSQNRELFDPLCEYSVVRGQAGFILYVSEWHIDAKTAQS